MNQIGYGVYHGYLDCKTKRIFAIACAGKKLVFRTEICEFREYRILKIGLFRRVKDLSKLNQTGHGVYHGYLDCKTKRIFAIACAGKKLVFRTEICEFREYRILKIGLFRRVKDLSKSNQTRYGVSLVYIKSNTKRVFAIDCLGNKLVFHTEICEFREYRILKIGLFHRFKDLYKLNQTRYGVSHGYIKSKTKRVFAIDCLGKKLVFHTEICEFREYRILKIDLFHRVKDLSKLNQTGYGVYHGYLDCKTKRIFAIACARKKLVFRTEICEFREYRILKTGVFHWVKDLSKLNQTGHGVYHGCLDCKTKRIFAIACAGKKLVFRTEICEFREYRILKIGLFRRVKDLSKSNQTRYGVSFVYIKSKTKRVFAIDCLGKKLVFHTEICEFREYRILKIGLFHRVRDLSKLNQTGYGVYQGYLDCKTKRIFAIACAGKKLVFRTEICEFREYRILKIGLFHRVKDLSKTNQTGHGVYHGYLDCKTKKNFCDSLRRKKLVFRT